MASFKSSFVVKPHAGIAFTKHIEIVERETCIAILCESSDGECSHILEPEFNARFVKALGAAANTSVLEAVEAAVAQGLEALVDSQVHAIVKPDFVWYDFDSPFYGDVYIESIIDADGKWIRVN